MSEAQKIKLALQWMEDEGIPAHEDDGSIYITTGMDSYDLQISTAEINYRADLQLQV
tara:strand:- start:4003 stop:4173 length:171 start_codon:yes stop_codon:yes gene_type:complete